MKRYSASFKHRNTLPAYYTDVRHHQYYSSSGVKCQTLSLSRDQRKLTKCRDADCGTQSFSLFMNIDDDHDVL